MSAEGLKKRRGGPSRGRPTRCGCRTSHSTQPCPTDIYYDLANSTMMWQAQQPCLNIARMTNPHCRPGKPISKQHEDVENPAMTWRTQQTAGNPGPSMADHGDPQSTVTEWVVQLLPSTSNWPPCPQAPWVAATLQHTSPRWPTTHQASTQCCHVTSECECTNCSRHESTHICWVEHCEHTWVTHTHHYQVMYADPSYITCKIHRTLLFHHHLTPMKTGLDQSQTGLVTAKDWKRPVCCSSVRFFWSFSNWKDQLQLWSKALRTKRPDRTGLSNTRNFPGISMENSWNSTGNPAEFTGMWYSYHSGGIRMERNSWRRVKYCDLGSLYQAHL